MPEDSHDFSVPRTVREICRRLAEAGESAYVVGGSLRDLIRGRTPVDWDLATTAVPQRMIEIFERVIPTGIDHGTVTVLSHGNAVEVTTLRGEGAYTDGRHPDRVEFLDDIAEDLARRDFTINAMAYEPATGEFHDPFGGRRDLEAGLIRAVGDPAARFAEDGLRVLRAARFAATLAFEVEPATLAAMGAAAARLAGVSVERKRDELQKTLLAGRPSVGLELMERTGMLQHLAPELAELVGRPARGPGPADAWRHTLERVDAVPARPHLRLAALLADVAGNGADRAPRQRVAALLAGLRLDRKTRDRVAQLLAHLDVEYDPGWTDGDLRRLLRRVGPDLIDDLLTLERADLDALEPGVRTARRLSELGARLDRIRAESPPLTVGELAVDGEDLMRELGIGPGPLVGRILDALLDRVVEQPTENRRDRLLEAARELEKE